MKLFNLKMNQFDHLKMWQLVTLLLSFFRSKQYSTYSKSNFLSRKNFRETGKFRGTRKSPSRTSIFQEWNGVFTVSLDFFGFVFGSRQKGNKGFVPGDFRIILALLCLGIVPLTQAQTTSQNYIQTTVPVTEVQDQVALDALSDSEKRGTVTYFDGLGRPIQQVAKRSSNNFKDIIQITEYDALGRSSKQYLPYRSTQNNGAYISTATTDQASFYTSTARVAYSNYPFSETVFDNSPLNRVLEQSAPGQDWQLGNGHTHQMSFDINAANEVRLFEESAGNITSSGYYASQEILKNVITDEHGLSTTEYVDKEGNTVLKKVQLDATSYTETYYVYNNFNRLVGVIPPQAYADMSTYDVNAEISDRVYRYSYDKRQRLVEKKIPHKGWEYIVYDKLDRPILTQDAEQRANNQWSFIKYDVLGREVLAGLYSSSASRTSMQSSADAATYLYEETSSSNFSTQHGYTNQAFPTGTLDIHIANYFDNYDFNRDGNNDVSFSAPPTSFSGSTSMSNRTRSLATGSKVKVLDGNSTYLTSAIFYDEKRRPIQTYMENYIGGDDILFTEYNFIGQAIRTSHMHYNGAETTEINQRFTYDEAGRLQYTFHQIDAQDEILYAENKYNGLGQLIDRKLHSTNLSTPQFLQSIDYAYNIRGWLTHINNADLDEDEYVADNTASGTIQSIGISEISFIVDEVDNELEGHFLRLLMEDESEIVVQGAVDLETYTNDGAANVFMMPYPGEEDTDNMDIYNSLLSLLEVPYSIDYSEELGVDINTELEILQNQIFSDVENQLSEFEDEEALLKIKETVFNYVSGKVAHVIETPSAAFSSEYLQFYFEERNGYQLYLNIYDANQSQSYSVYIMDNTDPVEYNALWGLTNDNSTNPAQISNIIVNFAFANLYEGMGTVEAIAECKRYLSQVVEIGLGISNTRTLEQMENFAAFYAVNAFGNVFFNDDSNDLWGMELKYNGITNQGGVFPLNNNALYNGNISEMSWKSAGDNTKRAYGYQYDGLNRLTQATYRAFANEATGWNAEVDRYSVPNISYDLNGNIQNLQRNGFSSGTINVDAAFGLMDNLSYSYTGDQLNSVADAAAHYQNDFNDGNTLGNDYLYDLNGNMTEDKNKDITITYNHLNLPETVSNGNNETVSYIYDAMGSKLQKTHDNNGTLTKTDYSAIGNYITPDGGNRAIDFIFTEDGRLVQDGNEYRYEYFIKDHLGNTRISFSDYDNNQSISKSEIGQQNNYYPFGLTHEGTYYGVATLTDHKYLYNGKEAQNEMGIDWIDYGARNYDLALGRWMNIDPLIEKYKSISTYNYANNNPIFYLDKEGREIVIANNTAGALTNLAKIAATSKGEIRLDRLIKSGRTYKMVGVFWSSNSRYYSRKTRDGLSMVRAGTIQYSSNPLMPNLEGGATSSLYFLAHETEHAFDDDNGKRMYEVKERENSAVRFANYIRATYGESRMRTAYGTYGLRFPKQPESYNGNNESISNFKNEFSLSAEGNTYMGFSYNKSENGSEANEYIISVKTDDNKFVYRKFKDKKEYQKALARIKKLTQDNNEKQ